MADFPVVPERLALVNVDMQNCFVEDAADGYAVLERINRLAAVCRDVGVQVVHARHVLRPDKSNVGVFGEIFPWESLTKILPEDERGALHQGVVVDPRDLLLAIDADHMTVVLHETLKPTTYGGLDGTAIHPPAEVGQQPDKNAVRHHRERSGL